MVGKSRKLLQLCCCLITRHIAAAANRRINFSAQRSTVGCPAWQEGRPQNSKSFFPPSSLPFLAFQKVEVVVVVAFKRISNAPVNFPSPLSLFPPLFVQPTLPCAAQDEEGSNHCRKKLVEGIKKFVRVPLSSVYLWQRKNRFELALSLSYVLPILGFL